MWCCPHCSKFSLSTTLNNIVEAGSGVAMLFNVVDNLKQCGPKNIVQFCSQQHGYRLMIFCRVPLICGQQNYILGERGNYLLCED